MTVHHSPSPDLLDVQGIAEYLNITPRNARRIVSERRVPVLKIGALVRVRRADLDAYLAAHTLSAAPSRDDRSLLESRTAGTRQAAGKGVG
jgi:excisionase family DNA binding protein